MLTLQSGTVGRLGEGVWRVAVGTGGGGGRRSWRPTVGMIRCDACQGSRPRPLGGWWRGGGSRWTSWGLGGVVVVSAPRLTASAPAPPGRNRAARCEEQ